MKKNVNKALAGIMMASLLMSGCGADAVKEAQNEVQNEVQNESTVTADSTPENTEVSMEESFLDEEVSESVQKDGIWEVTDSISEEGTYKEVYYAYHIPQFSDPNAEALNERIKADVMSTYEEEKKNMSEDCDIDCSTIIHFDFVNDNVLSVLLTMTYESGFINNYGYNYDYVANKEMSNADLIKVAGKSEAEVLDACKNFAKESFEAKIADYDTEEEIDADMYIRNNESNITMDMAMFLDDTGALNVMVPVASIMTDDNGDIIS